MAKIVLIDSRLFVAGADLASVTNKIEITGEREVKDTTNFASEGWKECIAGLGSAEVKGEGFFEASTLANEDGSAWANLGGLQPMSVAPVAVSVGSLAYLVSALQTELGILKGATGDVAGFSLSGKASNPMARGRVAQAPSAVMNSNANAAGYQLGAVATGQRLYANLHVLSVSGTDTPTLNMIIESDDNASFTSATTRISFAAATAIGGQSASVAGPITDDYWRARWTVSGTSPSFLGFVTIGIA